MSKKKSSKKSSKSEKSDKHRRSRSKSTDISSKKSSISKKESKSKKSKSSKKSSPKPDPIKQTPLELPIDAVTKTCSSQDNTPNKEVKKEANDLKKISCRLNLDYDDDDDDAEDEPVLSTKLEIINVKMNSQVSQFRYQFNLKSFFVNNSSFFKE